MKDPKDIKDRERPSPEAPDVAQAVKAKTRLSRLVDTFRWLTRILATALALIFAWLKLRGIPMPSITTEPAAQVLLRLTLVAYYFSWIVAVTWDTRDEEDVLYTAPDAGRIPVAAVIVALLLGIGFGALCWVSNYRQFAVALAGFWIANILAWRYLVHWLVRPAVDESIAAFGKAQALVEQERVRILDQFLSGAWQWKRFAAGGVSIAVLTFLAYSPDRTAALAGKTGFLSGAGLVAAAIALHVAIFEGWVWSQRLKRRFGIRQLEELSERYLLGERKAG